MYSWLGTLKRKPIDDSEVALDASAPFYEASFEVICRHFLYPNKPGSWTTWDSFPWLVEADKRTGDSSIEQIHLKLSTSDVTTDLP